MQSPSKKNTVPIPKPETKIKIKRVKPKSDDEEFESAEKVQYTVEPSVKKPTASTASVKKSLSVSSPKKKTIEEQDVSNNISSSSSGVPETTIGRSGRVRKAKIVFDPSDDYYQSSKRRSAAASVSSDSETKTKKQPPKATETKKEATKKPETELPNPPAISKRRKTIASFENGCIVCSRSDIKKGRFVNCIECNSRGHFTCLRNAKLISNSDQENNWQCAVCLTCAICYESSVFVSKT